MKIDLVYTIVPCADSIITRNFYKRIFNFQIIDSNKEDEIIIKINEKLYFKLEEDDEFTNNQFSFDVDREYFDKIMKNIKKENLLFGSSDLEFENLKTFKGDGIEEFFFVDPNAHLFNIVTKEDI